MLFVQFIQPFFLQNSINPVKLLLNFVYQFQISSICRQTMVFLNLFQQQAFITNILYKQAIFLFRVTSWVVAPQKQKPSHYLLGLVDKELQSQIIKRFSNLQCYEQQMSCYDVLLFLRRLCGKCFYINSGSKPQVLEESLIQMEGPKLAQQPTQVLVNQQTKFPNSSLAPGKQIKRKQQPFVKQSPKTPVNQDQFDSIDSSFCFQTDRSIRSTKILKSQLEKLQRSQKQLTNKKKKSILNSPGDWEDTPVVEKLIVQDQIQQVKDWFKSQYGKTKQASFRVNHAVRLRMQGPGMLTLLVRKLEDFKIKFLGQSITQQLRFCNKSKTFSFQHLKDEIGQPAFSRTKILKYYQIKSNAPTLQQIIRALVSRQAMKIMHDFISIQPVQYQGGNLRIPFPILQVRKPNTKISQQRVFHLASQIGESKQSREEERQFVFVCYSLDESEQSWNCVFKISFGFISHIQIYSESYEDLQQGSQILLKRKFTSFQKYLQELKIISVY